MLSTKNAMLSQSAADLGLGDGLKAQVENQLQQRKKKLLQNTGLGMPSAAGPATQSLFSGLMGGLDG